MTSSEHWVKRAKAILEAWDQSRQPFILYLRTFSVTMYHGPAQRMLLENHFWAALSLHRVGVLTIVNPEEVPLLGAFGHGAPALLLSKAEWQDAASELIAKAEMIVSEVPLLTPGAKFELDTCVQKGKSGQTVVIIPSPDGPFPHQDDEQTVKNFPRVIYYDELPDLGAVNHFVFRDLVDRARAIASLEPSERRAMVDAGQIYDRFPLTFAGLREGYEKAAAEYKMERQLRKAARSYFRALVVASMKSKLAVAGLAIPNDDAAIAAISEEVAHLALAIGDPPAAVNYLKGGIKFAVRVGDEPRHQRMEELLRQLETAE